jgi:hypothetical protein
MRGVPAIDLDADDNTFKDHWPMQADMPLAIMEAFALRRMAFRRCLLGIRRNALPKP